MTDRIGQQLGNYHLIQLIGYGGFAEVYLGEHLHLKSLAAIKVLHTSLEDDDAEGFLREAQIVARLKHPHIVRVLDFDVEAHTPFLVMDYLPNGNVRRSHPKGTPLPLVTVVSYVKQVASALQYAHDQKLVHRDVKPENMLLDQGGEIVLSDFGIALTAQSSRYQRTQEIAGTAAYMAPEQFEGKPRQASDQYSLGVVVYEWLTGDCPFNGSFIEVASQHLFVAPSTLRERAPTIPSDVEQVVLTALQKDPHNRFKSVQAFANALEQASRSSSSARVVIPLNQPSLRTNMLAPSHTEQTPVVAPPSPTPAALPLTTQATVPSGESQLPKRGVSRRIVLAGMGAVAGLAATGIGITWWTLSPRQHSSSVRPTTVSTTTTTPSPHQGETLYIYRGHSQLVLDVIWSPDGKRIASGGADRTAQVWDATTGSNALIYRGHANKVRVVPWSPDRKRIASGSDDTTVQVWDATTSSRFFTYRGHSNKVLDAMWSPDGKRIASGGWDKTVQVWDATTGTRFFTYRGHSDFVNAVAWSPDGKCMASGSDDQTAQVWDATTGKHIYTYGGHSVEVRDVAWSPDGKRIASGGADKTVQVWDATTGDNALIYRGHSGYVYAVAWSPDGSSIVSASYDKTVQVWNAATGKLIYTYYGHSDVVEAVAWSPDGKRIASGGADETVQVWQAP